MIPAKIVDIFVILFAEFRKPMYLHKILRNMAIREHGGMEKSKKFLYTVYVSMPNTLLREIGDNLCFRSRKQSFRNLNRHLFSVRGPP